MEIKDWTLGDPKWQPPSRLLGQQLSHSFVFKQETHCQGNESFFVEASLRQSRFSFLSSKVKLHKHTNI